MTSKGMSPLRLFAQQSPKKVPKENVTSNGTGTVLPDGRHPLCPIPEASRNPLADNGDVSLSKVKPEPTTQPTTPRGTKRGASSYTQSENMDGNLGSASSSPDSKPIKTSANHVGTVKAKCTWQYKQPASHGLELPSTSSLRRSPSIARTWQDTGGNRGESDTGSTPANKIRCTSSHSVPTSGASKNGSPRVSKITGKPLLDADVSKVSLSCSNAAASPNRSVTRSLRYGVTPSNASASGSLVNAPGTRGATGSHTGSVGKSAGLMQQPSQHSLEQFFELEEDPIFWKDHNVQVILRTRPINTSESSLQGFNRCVRQENAHTISWIGQPESRYTFDHVAGELVTQEKLFRVAGLPMVENCMAGYNSCMFCYGQTGSGKTHTMLGDTVDLEHRPSENRGMTPRVFEYLFAKIRKDEEACKHEHLKFVCKCSFLEIFNEQITDLLEPTSTNLQMREDGKKGVYVENLSEVEVESVQDVVHLLLLGAANRKVAATNMNRESSRSHSVFTCIIESKWEFESMTNLRFGRLNLVDLAGSERQKNSGAEGERLKEAANINKSLSTLGLVIMILVDVANGKQRHVPYRDSKLTFLLQDSLGGNSKTTMIANISPSTCCALETLSTLKFAQRAKFIRNNAVVNEDASGDVNDLRQEIQELKEELDRVRRQGVSKTPSIQFVGSMHQDNLLGEDHSLGMAMVTVGEQEQARCSLDSREFSKALSGPRISYKKLKAMEAILAGALRREQLADLSQKRLVAEIEQLNRLVRQREDDSQCSKMMLRFREDKIKRLESLSAGLLSADTYLMQEKNSLVEELQLIRAKMDRNPELTRFAMENIRLLDKLRRFQEFYTSGEREEMVEEISNLRDQLLEVLNSKLSLDALTTPQREALAPELACAKREIELLRIEADNYRREVEECRKNLSTILDSNSKVARQLDEAHAELKGLKSECSAQGEELEALRERALDLEAVEWGHAQHLEFISNLKAQLQQSEERAAHEASMRSQLDERLKVSIQNACNIHAELQETKKALEAAEIFAVRLQSTEASLAASQETASSAQDALMQIRLEKEDIAKQQRDSLENIEEAALAWRRKESDLRNELKEAHSLIKRSSDKERNPVMHAEAVGKEGRFQELNDVKTIMLDFFSLDKESEEEPAHHKEVEEKSNHHISQQLEEALTTLKGEDEVVEALENQQLCTINELETLQMKHEKTLEKLRKREDRERGLKKWISQLEWQLKKGQEVRCLEKELERASQESEDGVRDKLKRSQVEGTLERTKGELETAQALISKFQEERDSQINMDQEMDIAESETARAIIFLQEEIIKLQKEAAAAVQNEDLAKESVAELVAELQSLKVKAVQEESEMSASQNRISSEEKHVEIGPLKKEWETATARLLEHLTEGEDALTEAVHEMDGIMEDSLSQTKLYSSERQFKQVVVQMLEKNKSADFLQMQLQQARDLVTDAERKVQALSKVANDLSLEPCKQSEILQQKIAATEAKLHDLERTSTASSIMLWWLLEKLERGVSAVERMRVELERGSVEVSSLQLEVDGSVTIIEESGCLPSKFQNQLDHDQVLLKAAEEEAVVQLSVHNQSLEDLNRLKHELVAVIEDKEQKDVQLVHMRGESSKLHLELVGCNKKFVQLSMEKEKLEVQQTEDGEKWEKVSTVASIMVCWLQKKLEVDQDFQKPLGAEFGTKLEEQERIISDLHVQMVINQAVLEKGEEKLEAMLDECQTLRLDLESASAGIEQKDLSLVVMRMDVKKLQEDLISCEIQRVHLAQAKERLEVEGAESGEALEALRQKVSQVEMQLQVAEGEAKEIATAQEGLAVAQEEWRLEKAGLVAAAKESVERNLKLEQELKSAYDELDKIQTDIYDLEAREFAVEEERNILVTKLEGKVEALQMRADTSEHQLELREKRMVELDEVISKQLKDWDAEKETLLLAAQSADDLCFQRDQELLCVQESLVTLQSQMTEAEARETSLSQHMEELQESKEESDRENRKLQHEVAVSKGQVEDLSLQVTILGVEIRGQEATLESKLQKAEENVGGAQQQMKLMLAEMEAFSLVKEKLEIETENLETEVTELLASFAEREEYCKGIEDDLEKAHEDKKEIEDLSAAHENKLLEDLEDLHSENAELHLRGEKLEDALESAKNLVMQKEEEMVVVRRNSVEIEMKSKQAQEQLGASTVLMKQFAISEKGWKSEKDSLRAETMKLKSCMACQEMEFSALQSQKEVLEKSLQEAHESESLANLNLAKLQEKFDNMQTQWDIEKEHLSNGLAKASRELLEKQEKRDACERTLQAVQEKELTVSKNYVTILERVGELENCWAGERKEMSDHLATLFMDLSDVKACSQRTQVELAKARSLLIAADEGIKYLVDINSSIKEENKQLHSEQQALRIELSYWEQYAAELQMTSNHAPSPLKENRSIAASESLPVNKHFDGLKKEVDRMTRETKKLRAQVLDKDSTIFTVQMELKAAIATGKEVKLELERAVQEKKKYEYELTNMIRALTSVNDEVSWRKGQVEEFESELQRLMKILVETEERMDEAELKWRKEREELETQKEEAKLDASEKGSEITTLWKKFENEQATLQEVEVLVNALVRANEMAKIKSLEWKTEKEKIFFQSTVILSHLEEEVQLTMSEVERNIQSFGAEIRGMSSIVREDYLQASVGLHRELEKVLTIQNTELGTAKWDAQSREAASNARLTDVEEMLQESLVDIARLQTALGATEAELTTSQEALRNLINEFKTQEMASEGTRKELELVKAAMAEKGISMSCLSLKHDQNTERVAELERLSERWQELCSGGEKVKVLERNKLESYELMTQKDAPPDNFTEAYGERQYEGEDAAEIALYEKEETAKCLVTDLNLLQRTVSFVNGDSHLKAEIATRLELLGQLMQSQEEVGVEKEAKSQLECRRDQLLETVSHLEEQRSDLKQKVERNVINLELQVRQLETKAEETSTTSSKLEIELEIITTMLASTTRELREKETIVAKSQEELEESHLQNAEMLRSSQEIVNLVQTQLDSSVLEVSELKKAKREEVQSQSRVIADLKVQVQAHENLILELRIAASQLEEQKIVEREAVENEIKDFKSREGELEAALCNWQRRTQKVEILLDERDFTIASLNLELVQIQKNFKEEVETVDKQLQESRQNVVDLEFEREVLFKEIERVASAFAEIHDSHQENVRHLSAHLIDKEVLQSLEEKKAELKSIIKELNVEVAVNQQRAVTAEALLIDTRLEMEALLRELKQKEDLLQGLEFDISLLQESAMHELHLKQEVEMSRDKIQSLQQEVTLQRDRKIKLEEDLAEKTEQVNQIGNQASDWKAKACSLENELDMRRQSIESLEDELQMVEQNMANALEDASGDLKELENESDRLHTELLLVTEQLEMAQVYAEERDAIAAEARQVAELSKTHAEEKEEEANLLGRSVEELESTVYALESQLGILKQEVERQRLLREDMEMELQGLENHIFIMQAALSEAGAQSAEGLRETESAKNESERKLEEKETEVLQLQRNLENLQISSNEKDAQLKDLMAQISELLLALERQTSDFQQKKQLKAGEFKVEQGKSDERTTQSCYTSPKSGEKIAVKVKGSGAPFKCIGSGLAQQMSSEVDAERFSYERRIEELEALATARQKEVFLLNSRLAEAESMTHDVLRDLLGVKSDITSVASMLGQQQVQQLAESARRKNAEADEKEAELCKLRSQITGFIEERESWLEEIHRRQSEMVAARVAAEKLRQRDQALTTELEMLKDEGTNQQERIGELDVEVKKLSGQQNLQQRIHHHAKIKEENYSLRLGNEELSGTLRRTELLFARVNDELARYRAAEGKTPSLNIDEEERLRTQLQEADEGRIQAAQQLISLCTAIMQAAGVSGSEKDLDLAVALNALQQLEDRLHFTEQELSDVKIKTKIAGEKKRLNDIRAVHTPLKSIGNFSSLQRASSPSPAPR